MTPRRIAALLAVAAVLLAGCGGGGTSEAGTGTTQRQPAPEPAFLQVNLPGEANPEAAGFLLAHKLGYFPQAKFHAWFIAPSDSARPPMYVDQELVNAAMVHEPQAIQAIDIGRPLVIFGSLVPHPTMAMIWLTGSGIASVADLKGKTIAYPGVPFQKDFLAALLERAGLTLADVKVKRVGYFLQSELIEGHADAIFGGSMDAEGRLLEARGLDPVVTPVTQLGVPDYDELVMVARRDRYEEDPDLYQRLLRSTVRGGVSVGEQPGAAAKAILEAQKTELPARPIRAGVEEMAPRFSRSGQIEPAKLKRLIEWMYEEGMIERKIPVSAVLPKP
jgi:putative hydroxymethylpyrimidine transport system substrate-binding protein